MIFYMVKCQVTKTIEGAQEPPRERQERDKPGTTQSGNQTHAANTGWDPDSTPGHPSNPTGVTAQEEGKQLHTGRKQPDNQNAPQGETIDDCSCFDGVWCWMVLSTPEMMMKQSSMLRTMVGGDLEEELDSPLKGG